MSLLRSPITPPAKRAQHRIDESFRVKHVRRRRIFRAELIDNDSALVVPVYGRVRIPRVISIEQLESEYVRVVRCRACGWHHDVTKQIRLGCRG